MSNEKQIQKTPRTYLPKKVAEALRQHVPEELSVMMRDRLEHADNILEQNKVLAGHNVKLRDELDEHAKIGSARSMLKREEEALAETRQAIKYREFSLTEHELRHELEAQIKISRVLESTLAGIVRNSEWRESLLYDLEDYIQNPDGSSSRVSRVTEKQETKT